MWTRGFDSFLLDIAVKSTAVLLLAWAASLSLRRGSAALRHLVWATSLAALLALPLLSRVLPTWNLQQWLPPDHAPSASVPTPVDVEAANANGLVDPRKRSSGSMTATSEVAAVSISPISFTTSASSVEPAAMESERADLTPTVSWLAILWCAGVAPSLLWIAGGWLSLRRLTQSCRQIEHGLLRNALVDVKHRLGIRRSVRLLVTSERSIPMTWGTFRPTVLLPDEATQWSNARLRMVLTHELGHARRCDCLMQTAAHVARGLYWFHPLAWLAVGQLRIEQEQACDDLVLESGVPAPDYAESLLAVTAGTPSYAWLAPLALGMGRSTKLQQRLINVLDEGRNHRPLRRLTASLVVTFVIACLLPLASAVILLSPRDAIADEPKQQAQSPAPDKDTLARKLNEVREKLAKNYVGPLDDKALVEHALKGLLQGLKDPYTDYITTEDLNQLDKQLNGKLSGIGAQLKLVNDRLTVVTPLEGSPALKAGLRPDDVIDAIDGKSARGRAMSDLVQQIVGPAGSVVKLKIIQADGTTKDVPVTRGEIRIRTVIGFRRGADGAWQFLLDPKNDVGYVRILQFSRGTAGEVRDAVKAIQKDGLKGLILDLRQCPGGLLDQALDVCKLFLDKGTLLTTRGPGQEEKVFMADGKDTLGDFPVIILINEQTASAAEIVAGALSDNKRAVLLGTRTFGKGSVQAVLKLDEGGALKMTTAYHYLPSGRNIQKRPGEKTWGIDPSNGFYYPITAGQAQALSKDFENRSVIDPNRDKGSETPLSPKEIQDKHADPQLAAALRSMVARITGGEFLQVGSELGTAQASRIEELRERRAELQRNLNQLDTDLGELLRTNGPEKEKSQKR